MKKILFIAGLFAGSFSYGANWVYVTSSSSNQNFYIDKDFYKYNNNLKTVDVWDKTTKKKLFEDGYYTQSKTLTKYSCENKSAKTLAFVNYNESGETLKSSTKPEGEFSLIFPDSVGETMWRVVCDSRGKGFKFPTYNPDFVDLKELGSK